MKLLVLTMEKFQEIEMYGFLGVLKRSKKIQDIVFWNPNNLVKVIGSNQIGSIKPNVSKLHVDDFDAIFVPGGPACIDLRSNVEAISIIKEFVAKDKWIFAICDGPNALYENGIFVDKNYSSYPIYQDSSKYGKNRTDDYVSVDGKYITGKCPSASIDLGLKVLEVVYGKELSNQIYHEIYAIEK